MTFSEILARDIEREPILVLKLHVTSLSRQQTIMMGLLLPVCTARQLRIKKMVAFVLASQSISHEEGIHDHSMPNKRPT